MRRVIGLIGVMILVGMMVQSGDCWQRKWKRTLPIYEDMGDTSYMFIVSVSTGVTNSYAVLLAATYSGYNIRKAVICNSEAYDLFLSTGTPVKSFTTDTMTLVPQNTCLEVPYGVQNYYGLYESAAGGPKKVHGMVTKDSRE